MKSKRYLPRSSTEDFCSYSILEVYEMSEEIAKELDRGLQFIFLIESVRDQEGNGPGAPQMTSAYVPF